MCFLLLFEVFFSRNINILIRGVVVGSFLLVIMAWFLFFNLLKWLDLNLCVDFKGLNHCNVAHNQLLYLSTCNLKGKYSGVFERIKYECSIVKVLLV